MEKLLKEARETELTAITRRHFLMDCVAGVGGIALGSRLGASCTSPRAGTAPGGPLTDSMNPLAPKLPHLAGRAQTVTHLRVAGAPSQLELFDYKPELHKLHNQLCPPSLLEGKKFAFIRGTPKMLGPLASFKQHGESGAWVSDLLPHFSQVV